ncbi:MAG: TPM domain-containing protein [Bacteroidaceae bacterium]|nr:TPM domain-containing protein [Bacteroidaceae bacterium]
MRKLLFILSFFCLLGNLTLQAKEYTIQEIPMVHLQDRTRYVSNPDGILSESAVATIDNILYNLEQKTGIQTLVVVVTGIEGGDCFEFAYRLGKEKGVGQKGRDNGLVILLSTDERCIQFATGYGLEGVLPDAICKRIQNRYMIEPFSKGDWNTGMVEGIRAVNSYLDGSMENFEQKGEENMLPIYIFGAFFLGILGLSSYSVWKQNRCPKCKKHKIQRISSRIISRSNGYIVEETTYLCQNCGHTFNRQTKSSDPNYRNPGGGIGPIFMGGGFGGRRGGGFGGGGFGGGSFGGGSFGGGGAGSRF